MKVMVLFISLLDNYQHLILALESLKLEDRTWDDVNIRLLNEELMRKEKGGLSNEVALFAQRQSDFKKGMRGKGKDVCNYCTQLGHWYRDCKKKNLTYCRSKKIEDGNIIESEEAFVFALSIFHGIDAWYIDFGASMHLFSRT